jgi:integrase
VHAAHVQTDGSVDRAPDPLDHHRPLNAAVRWDWINTNPTKAAQRPKQKPPPPDPPAPAVAARLVEAAFEMDDDWGTLIWLVMTTGIRRGEICSLPSSRSDSASSNLTLTSDP